MSVNARQDVTFLGTSAVSRFHTTYYQEVAMLTHAVEHKKAIARINATY